MASKKRNQKTDVQTIEQNQQSNPGIVVLAGEVQHSDYDTKEWHELQKDYYQMRNSDAMLTTASEIVKFPIMMSEYRLEGPNQEINDYVKWVYDNLYKGFNYLKYHKLLAVEFGLSMHEMVVKRGDDYKGRLTNRPVFFSPIQNETIEGFLYGDQTQFKGIKHRKRVPEGTNELIDILSEDLEWFTYGEEFNDIRGRSLYRPIRLFWDSKQKIVIAKTTATQRGTGIVSIATEGDPSPADEAKIRTVGRTICMLREGYISYNKKKMSVDLLEPKSQQDVIPLLEYYDKQMFFNTMSQYMISGIGANGSRAATSEHKGSYEMFASYVLDCLELNFQRLTDRIIDMSCFGNMPKDQWTKFKFNAIESVDVTKVTNNIRTLYDAGFITKTPEDEKVLREILGLPKNDNPAPAPAPALAMHKMDKKPVKRSVSLEVVAFEDRVFSLESANEHFMTITEMAQEVIRKFVHEFITDVKGQLFNNRKNEILIRRSVVKGAVDALMEVYSTGLSRGIRDVKNEMKKIGGDGIKLAASKGGSNKKGKIMESNVKRLLFNMKNVIETKMQNVSDKFIEKQGGLDSYMDEFEEGFKADKNRISGAVEQSYTDGRGQTLLEFEYDIELYLVTCRMDKNLCEKCAPFDGQVMTRDEIENAGLMFEAPVNGACLGFDDCRCQIVAYKLRSAA